MTLVGTALCHFHAANLETYCRRLEEGPSATCFVKLQPRFTSVIGELVSPRVESVILCHGRHNFVKALVFS